LFVQNLANINKHRSVPTGTKGISDVILTHPGIRVARYAVALGEVRDDYAELIFTLMALQAKKRPGGHACLLVEHAETSGWNRSGASRMRRSISVRRSSVLSSASARDHGRPSRASRARAARCGLIDGNVAVTNTSSGGYAIATCSGTVLSERALMSRPSGSGFRGSVVVVVAAERQPHAERDRGRRMTVMASPIT
jgi:hypothetical protein